MESRWFKIFCFPWWIVRCLRRQDERICDLERRLQAVEDDIRVNRPDIQRRLQVVEESIRVNRPDIQRRLQEIEESIRVNRPDIQRRLQTVEDTIRATNPDVLRRLQAVEDTIRERVLSTPVYRELTAKRLPANCKCRHILGKQPVCPGKPRLLVDVSQLLIVNARSGIQRVVIRVLDAMLEDPEHLYVPVGLCRDTMHYVEYHQDEGAFYLGEPLKVMKNDTLLMLDSSWEFYDFFAKTFDQVHAAGGQVHVAVYDLIPLLQSEFVAEGMIPVFRNWLTAAVKIADGMVCISKTVAGQLRDYIGQTKLVHAAEPLRIGHFVLGADFAEETGEAVDPEVAGILERFRGRKKFISVSTIEPRKNYGFMLDVMEKLWARGYDVAYFIVGKHGWNVDDLVARIDGHPELGKRLFWFKSLGDNGLRQLYKASDILLNLSHGEGYGLSLVEGAHYGCAVAASDIPVFREVITDDTTLFCDIGSLEGTVDAIADRLDRDAFAPSAAKYYMWSDALSDINRCIRGGEWDFEVK